MPFDIHPQTRLVFGCGVSSRVGDLARELGFRRTLLVADKGLVVTGQIARATQWLTAAGLSVLPYHDFDSNPDSDMVEKGRACAALHAIDSIVAWGGGSSLDCAKGINFLLTNGGRMRDYRGYGKTSRSLLPMMAVPTTAGTGSEVQSYAIISDAGTREKMACGDPTAAFRVAILDPELTTSQPFGVTAASGFDAIAHAVETAVTRKRHEFSLLRAAYSKWMWAEASASVHRCKQPRRNGVAAAQAICQAAPRTEGADRTARRSSSRTGRTSPVGNVKRACVRPDAVTNSTSTASSPYS